MNRLDINDLGLGKMVPRMFASTKTSRIYKTILDLTKKQYEALEALDNQKPKLSTEDLDAAAKKVIPKRKQVRIDYEFRSGMPARVEEMVSMIALDPEANSAVKWDEAVFLAYKLSKEQAALQHHKARGVSLLKDPEPVDIEALTEKIRNEEYSKLQAEFQDKEAELKASFIEQASQARYEKDPDKDYYDTPVGMLPVSMMAYNFIMREYHALRDIENIRHNWDKYQRGYTGTLEKLDETYKSFMEHLNYVRKHNLSKEELDDLVTTLRDQARELGTGEDNELEKQETDLMSLLNKD